MEYQDKIAKEKQKEQQRLLQLEQERLKQQAEQQRLLQQQQVSEMITLFFTYVLT